MNCKYCGQNNKLIDAHIIPKCFYKPLKISKAGIKKYSSTEGVYPQRSPIGLYDQKILCQDCEGKFQIYDDYGCKILVHAKLPREFIKNVSGQNEGFLIHDIDYHKFKLFFMSILWRAAISSSDDLKKVKLGPHLKKLEQLVKDNNPGTYNDFSVILFEQKFLKDSPVLITPHRAKFMELNFYEISLGRIKALIKVDGRKIPRTATSFFLQPNKPVPIPYLPFSGSITEKIIRDTVIANKKI